tara:strand:+ start:209 stop:421 length:213 start_codon:yes stop_codon:yes gene_type:complete
MNNSKKAEIYHNLLLRHDKLDGLVADIKAEAAGMTLNDDQKNRLSELESQKAQVVVEAQRLFETFKATKA